MKPVYIDAVGLAAPGLSCWGAARAVLAGEAMLKPEPLARYRPQLLAANERRRATHIIRLAFQAGEDAVLDKDIELNKLAAVFATSGGDLDIIDSLCRVFSGPDRAVSPTQFHNSVHNSAAGYWSIGTGSQAPSSSLCACNYTFAAGLLEAVMFATVEVMPTLLVVYNISAPPPMREKVPGNTPFSMALLLSPQKTERSCARLTLKLVTGVCDESEALSAELDPMRKDNPAAKAIPLLELLARKMSGSLMFNTTSQQFIEVNMMQC